MRVEVLEREEIEEKMLMTPGDIVMMLNEMGGMRVQATSPSLGAASVRIQGMRGRYTRFLSDGLPLFGEQASLRLVSVARIRLGMAVGAAFELLRTRHLDHQAVATLWPAPHPAHNHICTRRWPRRSTSVNGPPAGHGQSSGRLIEFSDGRSRVDSIVAKVTGVQATAQSGHCHAAAGPAGTRTMRICCRSASQRMHLEIISVSRRVSSVVGFYGSYPAPAFEVSGPGQSDW
jgi:hypothetical protein